ncbi:MAG: hypothetical protein MZV70_43955 [Desulfobacterales bacterium]|nr:hypothetical protein [Desulfobacterales bacterium]
MRRQRRLHDAVLCWPIDGTTQDRAVGPGGARPGHSTTSRDSGRFEELAGRGAPLGIERGCGLRRTAQCSTSSRAGSSSSGRTGSGRPPAPDGRLVRKAALRDLILRPPATAAPGRSSKAIAQALEAYRQGPQTVG